MQRDEELVAAGAHTEHIHDTMLRLRAIAEDAGARRLRGWRRCHMKGGRLCGCNVCVNNRQLVLCWECVPGHLYAHIHTVDVCMNIGECMCV